MEERIFYIVEDDVVHISGELLYNGDGQLEYLEYVGCYVPIKNLGRDAICYAMEQSKQYYSKITEEEGKAIAREYFAGEPGSTLLFSEVNAKTSPGYYVSFGLYDD